MSDLVRNRQGVSRITVQQCVQHVVSVLMKHVRLSEKYTRCESRCESLSYITVQQCVQHVVSVLMKHVRLSEKYTRCESHHGTAVCTTCGLCLNETCQT